MNFSRFYLFNGKHDRLGRGLIIALLLSAGMAANGQTPSTNAAPVTPAAPEPAAAAASAPSGSAAENTQLQKVVVEAVSPESSTLPTRPTDSVYGLGDTVLDTPRSIYEVSKDQLKFDPINEVSDLAMYSPSVTASSGQGIGGAPYIRGYQAEVYQDGFRVGRFLRPWDPNTAYDSLDIVTGPASVVYGPSSKTSGYLDWTTKKPFFDANHTEIDLDFGQFTSGGQGSHAAFSQTVDNSGPIDPDLAYRVVYKQNEEGSYYIGGKNDYEHLYSALTWLPTKDITVDWNFEYGNYDYALLRGWNRINQNLIDNGTYDAGVATPVFKNGSVFYEPAANSPTATNTGYVLVTPNTLTGSTSSYAPGATVATINGSANPIGTLQGFVLRPGNITEQTIYPYQGAVNPSDPINLNQFTSEQNVTVNIDSQTVLLNKSFYEHDDYHQQTYDGASLQGTVGDSFENRTEFHENDENKVFGIDVEHKSNTGLDLHFLDETVVFNNANFLLNAYDISGDQLTNMNINNLYGLLASLPPGTLNGVIQTKAYGQIKLTPIYSVDGFSSPLGGVPGPGNYESKLTQAGLYTFHEFTFDKQWTWNIGARVTATYVNDTDPVEIPAGAPATYSGSLNDATLALEPVFTTSLSYKPVPWTTVYATYNYTQALNDDSGNSMGGVAPNANGQVGRAALHSDSVLYETGAKFEFLPNQLYGSIAGYYQNRQLAPVIVPGQNPIYPEVETHGFEAALNYQPNKNFSAGINYSWLEANYVKYNPNASFSSPYGVVADGTTVISATGSATNSLYPLGDYNIAEPKNRIDAFASYQFDFGLGFRADLWATSEWTMTNDLATIPAEYNLNLGVFYAQKNWRAQVDFLNVTDQTNFEIANQDSGENLLPSEPFAIQGKFTYKF
jgi:outer membrane receptor protein involved in Fe transport